MKDYKVHSLVQTSFAELPNWKLLRSGNNSLGTILDGKARTLRNGRTEHREG